ncbi:MAG: DUF3037 domain-containing protein [Muribaculaceae bacterium]|nr:DUF3037 domain-containing protein [Muribaculaceae bacterium]
MNENSLVYEYATLRYVPDIEREEFINVGLLMMCKRKRWYRCEVHLCADRLRALDPDVDIDMLREQLNMFRPDSPALADCPVEERFRWFTAVKSSMLQTSRPHPGLVDNAADLDPTFIRLFHKMVPGT